MMRRQKLFWLNTAALLSIIFLHGNSLPAYGQVQFDGIFVGRANAETNRAVFLKPDTFGETALIVGTDQGNASFAKMNVADSMQNLAFRPFIVLPKTNGLVRSVNFVSSNLGYLLKSDSIYSSNTATNMWNRVLDVNDKNFPKSPGSFAELWDMSFVDDRRVCVVGVYFRNGSDDIDKELLVCTDNISENIPRWEIPRTPQDRKTGQVQLTSVYFDKNEKGWATGTDGEAGIIWYSDNGGKSWEERDAALEEPLLSVYGTESKVFAVGFNGLAVSRKAGPSNAGTKKTQNNTSVIKPGDEVEVKGGILAGIPELAGIPRVRNVSMIIGEVKNVISNSRLVIEIKEILPGNVIDVRSISRTITVNRKDVKKIQNEGNEDLNMGNDNLPVWSKMTIPTKQSLRNVKFTQNGQTGFIVGEKGTILYTTNGGVSWQSLTAGMPLAQRRQLEVLDFYSIFIDDKYCWIGGSRGSVVRLKYVQENPKIN